jgi:hypothetical protein
LHDRRFEPGDARLVRALGSLNRQLAVFAELKALCEKVERLLIGLRYLGGIAISRWSSIKRK